MLLCQEIFCIIFVMKDIKALFIDCDGVLYDKRECTYHDIAIVGLGKTLDVLGMPQSELAPARAKLKANGVHGLLNAVLELCKQHHVQFDAFAHEMAQQVDYSRISEDWAMLKLLRECGSHMPIYIVTNNTRPHLDKIFACLRGGSIFEDLHKSLNVKSIAIEDTLKDGVFHPKKAGTQLADLCSQIGEKPENVLLLDDTQDVCDAAMAQGLQVQQIESPYDTKMILRRMIYEKSRPKTTLPVRKTRRLFGR